MRRGLSWFLILFLGLSQYGSAQPTGFLWEQVPRPPISDEFPIKNPQLNHYFDLTPGGVRPALIPVKEIDLFPSPELLATFATNTDRLGELFEIPQRHGSPRLAFRARAYVRPPLDGEYLFSLAGDDAGFLFLNSTGADPANVDRISLIGKSTPFREFNDSRASLQVQEPVTLEAGGRYFVEVMVYNSNTGNTHMSVQWNRPDGEVEIVPLRYLEPFEPSFKVQIEEPTNPGIIPSGVDREVVVVVNGPLGLIESMVLFVDGEVVNRLGRERFDEPYDRFDLQGTVTINWPQPLEGVHQIAVEIVDVIGSIPTRS